MLSSETEYAITIVDKALYVLFHHHSIRRVHGSVRVSSDTVLECAHNLRFDARACTGECGVVFCHFATSDLAAWHPRDGASVHRTSAHRLSPLYPRHTHIYMPSILRRQWCSLPEHFSQVPCLYLHNHQYCPDVNRTLIAQPGI
jgi:hypothetical protein